MGVLSKKSKEVEPVIYAEWKKTSLNACDGEFYCTNCGHTYDTADGGVSPIDCSQIRCYWCGAHMVYNKK